MDRENYSLTVTILRIIAAFFGLIAFGLMFVQQLSNGAMFNEIAFGTLPGSNPMPLAFVGYILVALAALVSIVLIFAKNALNAKAMKLLDFVVGIVFVIGAILIVLTKVWWYLGSAYQSNALWENTALSAGPIVSCVFACLAAALNIYNGIVEEKI